MSRSVHGIKDKLTIINLLKSNPKITIKKLSNFIDEESKIKKIIGQLFMVGSFPYSPSDYIEINIDGKEIHLNLPVQTKSSIALTTKEWLIIRDIIIQEIQSTTDPNDIKILTGIKEKINTVIPFSEYFHYIQLKEKIETSIKEKKKIQFEYKTNIHSTYKSRIIDPLFLFEQNVHYIVGYCHTKNELRTFKLESIKNFTKLEEDISNNQSPDIEKYIQSFNYFINRSNQTTEESEFIFEPNAYYSVSRTFTFHIISENYIFQNKKYIHARVKIYEKKWFIGAIKGFGSSILVLSPPEIIEELKNEFENVKIPKYKNNISC